jgi:hypothetical protein
MNKSLSWDWGNGEADLIIEYYCATADGSIGKEPARSKRSSIMIPAI